jgi:Family of unknown function (DUF5519)
MSTIIESIKKEILNWPDVTTEPHRFGGLEFRLNKREMGHIHMVINWQICPFLWML